MAKRQKKARTARRLPASFVPLPGGITDLFPEWYRTIQLFKEIADREGFDEADRIFTDVVKSARQAVKPRRGKRQPPPKKQKGRSHNPLADQKWLSVYDMVIQHLKLPEAEAKAKAIDFIEKQIPRYPGQQRSAIARQLDRLLARRSQDK
jgi:hypothetical protein